MAEALVSIQIIPKTPNGEESIPFVDEAISIIDQSDVNYHVGPLETTMEGELSELFAVIEKMNQRMHQLNCPSVISQVKIYSRQDRQASMTELTKKYR
ncbi:MTH1187 family thiamine-binding protein [Gracilibacillus caseinilyticus]|uniref:MTH1187 family thiamine-binding protein n=1 Tax=Gracilibacillus caseinilyticus TaxID=2932256 RepID=A0ABY4F229_9BACI|nr:MTH1187 family thiamine-binding protein [Gracilibacillus caseinilyticus]UOQ50593.1 MTH1187 family thiamine-binding protein [Gracilibacillus caseinilyticus]